MSLKIEWNDLVKSTEIDHAFMRHEWFESWIKNLMPKGELAIQIARDNDKLVAIAPLQITRDVRKNIPLKILSFLRSSVTSRSNFIIDSAIDPAPFFDFVFSTGGWRIAELKAIELTPRVTGDFIAYLNRTKRFVIEHGLQSPYEIIETDWDTYLKERSEGFRKSHRNSLNRAKKAKSFAIIELDDYEKFDEYFDTIVNISAKSWKKETGTDLQTMPEMASFFKDFCRLTSADGFVLSHILTIEDQPVAFDFYLKFKERLVALRWDYDEAFSYYMPGTLLHNNVIKTILDTGQSLELDLSGMATDHKKHVANKIRRHIDVTVEAPGIWGGLVMLLKKKSMQSKDITDTIVENRGTGD
jgi:CelD/BcsL family acetyltransferase involved in cellulose biosynthesis